ncbi:MAG: response regulator [Melioribacteraceae bacterium]
MAIFVVALIIFISADVLIRYILKIINEKKLKKERESVLNDTMNIDFSTEAVSLKRAEVPNPKARIICVDDENVILDSFRKILVLDGYSVDTVNSGEEALNLIKSNNYDFCFTDLKMPTMDGVEVCKSVKYLRPDMDVVIITGYATVETAVETMKVGAMDYVQKPFTEDELLEFVKKCLIKRSDRIKKELKPRVHIAHVSESTKLNQGEFAIPGGVFIAPGHTWVSVSIDGTASIGMDDFSKKLLGEIDDIELPTVGAKFAKGDKLFILKQNDKVLSFLSPLSGTVCEINHELLENLLTLDHSVYGKNFLCKIKAEKLDTELKDLKIGKEAVTFYQEEIDKYTEQIKELLQPKDNMFEEALFAGHMGKMDEKVWNRLSGEFFNK